MVAFPASEYRARLDRVRAEIDRLGLDGALVTAPENVLYLTGIEHRSSSLKALVVPLLGDPVLASSPARGRELHPLGLLRVLDPDPAAAVATAVQRSGLDRRRVGMEKGSSCLSVRLAEEIWAATPRATWVDATAVIDRVRLVQSPLELDQTRRAAQLSDTMVLAATAAAGVGVPYSHVVAAVHEALLRRGQGPPEFSPRIRSAAESLLSLEIAGSAAHYRAPVGRVLGLGRPMAPPEDEVARCREALRAAADSMGPGVSASEVFAAWRGAAGGPRRPHCGYAVGLGFRRSWWGCDGPPRLRKASRLVLQAGMVFHLMSWLPTADAVLSDTVVVTPDGHEFLTAAPSALTWRR
jgi:Xaa-Pro dipeptidase